MDEHVMVFAPAPLLTVTIEQQTDELELHVHPGGQGVWEARMLRSMGVSVTLCAAMGGEAGTVVAKLHGEAAPHTPRWYRPTSTGGSRPTSEATVCGWWPTSRAST